MVRSSTTSTLWRCPTATRLGPWTHLIPVPRPALPPGIQVSPSTSRPRPVGALWSRRRATPARVSPQAARDLLSLRPSSTPHTSSSPVANPILPTVPAYVSSSTHFSPSPHVSPNPAPTLHRSKQSGTVPKTRTRTHQARNREASSSCHSAHGTFRGCWSGTQTGECSSTSYWRRG